MVIIVTGKINSNKTTKMLEIYKKNKIGDGFISIKNMVHDTVHSYDAMQLSTQEKNVLIKRTTFFDNDFEIACQIGPYLFNETTLRWIDQSIIKLVHKGISPIYLDEIGLLELEDKGLHKTLSYLIKKKIPLILSIREDLVEAIKTKYNIEINEIVYAS